MTVTALLLDRWKSVRAITSDRQAAIALGVSHTAIQKWRDAGNATAAIIERMARDLGHTEQEIAVLLFESMAEAANADADSRRTYERLARKVQALALVAVAVLVSSSFPAPASAGDLPAARQNYASEAVFIMRSAARWLAEVWHRIRTRSGSPMAKESRHGTTALLRDARRHGLPA